MEDSPLKYITNKTCIIKLRDGRLLFTPPISNGKEVFMDANFRPIVSFGEYNYDLTSQTDSKYDIMEVYHPYSLVYFSRITQISHPIVWDRNKLDKITLTLKDIAEKFGVKEEQIIIKE